MARGRSLSPLSALLVEEQGKGKADAGKGKKGKGKASKKTMAMKAVARRVKAMKAVAPKLFKLTIQPSGTSCDEKWTLDDVNASDTIHKVKTKIRNYCGPQPFDQCLTFRGEEMMDRLTLAQYGIGRRVKLVWILTENGQNDVEMFETGDESSISSCWWS
jgi:hypothetical protein